MHGIIGSATPLCTVFHCASFFSVQSLTAASSGFKRAELVTDFRDLVGFLVLFFSGLLVTEFALT